MIPTLKGFEKEIENNISQFNPVGSAKKELIEGIIDRANEKRSISLRHKNNNLEQLKQL